MFIIAVVFMYFVHILLILRLNLREKCLRANVQIFYFIQLTPESKRKQTFVFMDKSNMEGEGEGFREGRLSYLGFGNLII